MFPFICNKTYTYLTTIRNVAVRQEGDVLLLETFKSIVNLYLLIKIIMSQTLALVGIEKPP
jgi:hypothetical protein